MRKLESLESFTDPEHLYNLLTFQKTFPKFLICIKNVVGASLKVCDDGDTVVMLNGKEVEGTKAKRFHTQDQLNDMLEIAGLA